MSPSSRLSATSTGAPSRNGTSELGEGDKITEGTLRWRPVGSAVPGSSEPEGDLSAGVSSVGAGISNSGAWFQSYPGLTIRFIVSPSLMLYSLSSFASARALPLRSNRCTSAGGAPGCEER